MHARTETAIARWLLSSSRAPDIPRQDWADGKPALLRTGAVFDAVRMPQPLVHAAVRSTVADVVAAALAETLDGPVIHDPMAWFYALVPPGTCETWRSPMATVRGAGGWLGVPRTDRTVPMRVTAYWAVPVERTDKLCDPAAVAKLLRVGRDRLEGGDR
ncbi:hypothetical protein ACFV0C_13295 [Streptomyces sp. NPDC059568]|uniref:hypothetical protein n=1 Tax=Streptomyces sp. NPDC059568 TaxID=3346868 RepID=UPI0036994E1C